MPQDPVGDEAAAASPARPRNSQAYWERRFASDWEQAGGPQQSASFMAALVACLPASLAAQISTQGLSLLDCGCAEGSGTAVLAERYPRSPVAGFDWSGEAIRNASRRHPRCEFFVADFENCARRADVLVCSNCLEHLADPLAALERFTQLARQAVVVLVPYCEQWPLTPEHARVFDAGTLPRQIAGWSLTGRTLLPELPEWRGHQLLLTYTPAGLDHPELEPLPGCHELAQSARLGAVQESLEALRAESKRASELEQQAERLTAKIASALSEGERLRTEREQLKSELAAASAQARQGRAELEAIYRSRLWKAGQAYRRMRHALGRAFLRARFSLGLAPQLGRGFAAQVDTIVAAHRGARETFVFLPALEWDLPLFQRPQQMALALAEAGALVFYVEPLHAGSLGLHEKRPGLFVGNVPLDCLRGLTRPVAWTLCWNTQHLPALRSPLVLYDHIDELSVFDAPHSRLLEAHARLLREADLVLTTARRLQRETLERRPDALLVPNGVDYAHFATGHPAGPRPAEWAVVPAGRPVVGYYGALARWLDYGLLVQAARSRRQFEFVLIGPDHDGTLAPSGALDLPNVHWLGPVAYERLPEHVRHFDVATIPFLLDDVTHSVSPLKLFEYMAAGKPIVVTAMEESLRYAGPLVAANADEFVQRLDEALSRGDDRELLAQLEQTALENTWAVRARQVLEAVAECRTRSESARS